MFRFLNYTILDRKSYDVDTIWPAASSGNIISMSIISCLTMSVQAVHKANKTLKY